MTKESEILYKGLVFIVGHQLNYLELIIDKENFFDQKKYISSVSVLLEYALSIHPKFIILNRSNHHFFVAQNLFPFTTNNIIAPLKYDGVRKIICLGSEQEYNDRYKAIEEKEPIIKWFESKASALEWIEKNQDLFPEP